MSSDRGRERAQKRRSEEGKGERTPRLWGEVLLVAGKDLRIEARSKVTIQQIVPFGLIVLLLFAFALDPDRGILHGSLPDSSG